MSSDNVLQLPLGTNATSPPREERDWLTSAELVTETGCSYRQLDYWTRVGLLTPIAARRPGSGHLRRYPEAAASRARAIGDLMYVGLDRVRIHAVLDQYLTDDRVDLGPITVVRNPPEEAS